ncbi:M20 family metallopeptidase [Christensenellaceae bacterium OttesenSCG-928-M15]|nr:M20 family metallopeptidase [Christensenellaceae bacterium OttesenSCG-928-M15]
MKNKLFSAIDQKQNELFAMARFLRENPETAMEEIKACEYISNYLKKEGFEVVADLGGLSTAFKATRKNGEGPRIAIIAEYDALPKIGHACGHHLIAATSVGAFLALCGALEQYEGEITLIGTPAEETAEGKPRLIEAGEFSGYDAAMMIHPSAITDVFPPSLCLGGFEYEFSGAPAHAGTAPDKGVNALDAVVIFYTAIGALRQQLKDGTRIHGIILEAGSAVNVIPDKGRVRLEIRAKEYTYYEEVVKKVENCAKAAALATGCGLSSGSFEPSCLALKSNRVLGDVMQESLLEMGILKEGQSGMLSTDMGNISQIMPAIHPFVKMAPGDEDIHTEAFLLATDTPYAKARMLHSAKALALTGLKLLENPELIKKAWEEFHQA